MPPSSGRRTRARRDLDLPEGSDPDVLDSSPSRPARKKRRTDNAESADAPPPNAGSADSKHKSKDENTPEKTSTELQNDVVASLLLPTRNPPLVSIDHANEMHERQHRNGVQAYAKIAGKEWTYYVKSLKINLGRPPDPTRPNESTSSTIDDPDNALTDDEDKTVHIDLGPSKVVSRLHATIEYVSSEAAGWILTCLGRNGVRVDDALIQKGKKKALTSGMVIEIGGTQMMFVTPQDAVQIHPMFIQQAQDEARGVRSRDPRERRLSQSIKPSLHELPDPSNKAKQTGHGGRAAKSDATILSTPTANRVGLNAGTKASPSYSRGLNLESTQDIDFSADSARELKPPYSYATMISQAILSSPDEKLTLNNIYSWIMEKYAFYRHSNSGWQNSIRHNLSLNKAFEKVPRRTDEPGKGMKWQIVAELRAEFVEKSSRPSKGAAGQRTSSVPTSPMVRDPSAISHGSPSGQHRLIADASTKPPTKRSTTPPPFELQPKGAYTPTRGPFPHRPNGLTPSKDVSPTGVNGRRKSSNTAAASLPAYGTSPTSLSPTYLDESSTQPMVTPAPQRQNPRLAPPSHSQVPSSFMTMSSPAPFWKYVDLGSTPAKALGDSSPLKLDNLVATTSSPPQARRSSIPGSPGLSREQPIVKTENVSEEHSDREPAAPEENTGEAEGGFDLTKGFQAIGKYHTNLTNAAA